MEKRSRKMPTRGTESVAAAAEPELVARNEALVDQLLGAHRSGDLSTTQRATERILGGGAVVDKGLQDMPAAADATTSRAAMPRAANTASLSPLAQYDRTAKATYDKALMDSRETLAKSFANPTAAESVLIDLVARELPIAHSLLDAQQKLAARLTLGPVLDNASWFRALARALHDVTVVNHAITRRVEGLLGAATNLRAQRRLLDMSERENGK
jgi:hypothetical protein